MRSRETPAGRTAHLCAVKGGKLRVYFLLGGAPMLTLSRQELQKKSRKVSPVKGKSFNRSISDPPPKGIEASPERRHGFIRSISYTLLKRLRLFPAGNHVSPAPLPTLSHKRSELHRRGGIVSPLANTSLSRSQSKSLPWPKQLSRSHKNPWLAIQKYNSFGCKPE